MNTASASVCAFPRKALWLPDGIARLLRSVPHQRVAQQEISFETLEPYDGKRSCTVLRGKGGVAAELPGLEKGNFAQLS
jgi:hypothetical protein